MRYKITVAELREVEGREWPQSREVYHQETDTLDLWAVIVAVNLTKGTPTPRELSSQALTNIANQSITR